jgi:hypothetical protein
MKVYLKDSLGVVMKTFNSKAEAAKEYNVSTTTVTRRTNKNIKTDDNLSWHLEIIDKSKCLKCSILLTNINKCKDRNQCNNCVAEKNRNCVVKKKAEIEQSGYIKICRTCELPAKSYRSVLHLECDDCAVKIKNISKEEYLRISGTTERKCLICSQTKEINKFPYHFRNFRNQCQSCLNSFRRYAICRLRKIERLGKEAVNAHNSKIHLKWCIDNKEHLDEYTKFYNNSAARVTSDYYIRYKEKILSKLDFKSFIFNLIMKDCFYCSRTATRENADENTLGDYNGVDRINSDIDYIESNCVPCCNRCNMAKNSMDIASFIRKCTEIANYNNLVEINEFFDIRLKYHSDIALVGISCDYKKYISGAKQRDKKFDITKEFFDNTVKKSCYLCGKYGELGIGIDRVDNSLGYCIENCKACCNYCNYMKRDSVYSEFLEHIKNIVNYSTDNVDLIKLCKVSEFAHVSASKNTPYENENIDLLDNILN